MIPSLDRVKTDREDLRQLQDSLDNVLNVIRLKQIIDGRIITGKEVAAAGSIDIEHGLGVKPRGWIIVGKNANVDIYETTNDFPTRFLRLTVTGAVTFSVWVF